MVPDKVKFINLQSRSHQEGKRQNTEDYPNPTKEKIRLQEALKVIKDKVEELEPAKRTVAARIEEIKQTLSKRTSEQVYQWKALIPKILSASKTNTTLSPTEREAKIELLMKLCTELNINIPLHLLIEWWHKGTFSQTQNEESTLLA
eukprot:Gb_35670 [translate_table: standard]